jgi:hypothetical protein
VTGHRDHRGAEAQRGQHADHHADGQGDAQRLEVRKVREAQTGRRAGDRQTRAQHDVSRAAEHGVVRLFLGLTETSGLLISPDEEYRVVGGRGYRQRDEQIGGERREPDDLVKTEERHETAGGGEFEHDHYEHQQHGDDRSVHQQQHDDDDRERDELDQLHAPVARDVLIGCQRSRTRHEDLHAVGWLKAGHDVLNGLDGLVGQRLALIATQVDLNVGGLAVVALRARRGQRVAPEVLDVLDVLGIGLELLDHLVVEGVGRATQRLLALQHDHRRTVRVELFEGLTDPLHGDHRRRLVRRHRDRTHLADLFELRNGDVQHRDDCDPDEDDRDG